MFRSETFVNGLKQMVGCSFNQVNSRLPPVCGFSSFPNTRQYISFHSFEPTNTHSILTMTNTNDSRQNQVSYHSDSKALEQSQLEKPVVDTHQSRRRGSCPLPLPEYHITRTESEIQLCEDMAIAEMRDRLMFTRLVNGIRQRQTLQRERPLSRLARSAL